MYQILILSLAFVAAVACRSTEKSHSVKDDPAPATSPENKSPLPFITVVPPLEFQTGGEEMYKKLQGTSKSQKLFVNQKLDLGLVGPGTNLIFVCDQSGENWSFAFSNGRFEGDEAIGSLAKKNYSNIEVSENGEGKYPWPTSGDGHFLPGNKLVTSNGPHRRLKNALLAQAEANKKPLTGTIIGGHVGVDADGSVYIGYISASTNKELNAEKPVAVDERSLPAKFRSDFHRSIGAAFSGRNLASILEGAPTSPDEIEGKRAQNTFPFSGSKVSTGQTIRSPMDFLQRMLPQKTVDEYVASLAPETVIRLLTHPNFKPKWDQTQQIQSRIDANVKALELIAEQVQSRFDRKMPIYRKHGDLTALQWAVTISAKEVISFLLEQGADPNSTDSYGETLLQTALVKNRHDVFALLLSKGAQFDPNRVGVGFRTPLVDVILRGNYLFAELLIANGANPNALDPFSGKSILELAIEMRNFDMVKLFLAEGADPNIKNQFGEVPLRSAVLRAYLSENYETIELLIEKGADPYLILHEVGDRSMRKRLLVFYEKYFPEKAYEARSNTGFTGLCNRLGEMFKFWRP